LVLKQPLAIVYYVKDDFRELWKYRDNRSAEVPLEDRVIRTNASGIRVVKVFVKTLCLHRAGILAYHDDTSSSGPLEGKFGRIETLHREA
jgi:transposase